MRNLPRKSPVKKKKIKKAANHRKELEALQKLVVRKLYGNDCYTCPSKNLQGSNCQLGHVPWPRSQLSVVCKFDYRYTRMQCFKCNIWNKGCGADAYKRMRLECDVDILEAHNLATKGKVCSNQWFITQIKNYEQLLLQ